MRGHLISMWHITTLTRHHHHLNTNPNLSPRNPSCRTIQCRHRHPRRQPSSATNHAPPPKRLLAFVAPSSPNLSIISRKQNPKSKSRSSPLTQALHRNNTTIKIASHRDPLQCHDHQSSPFSLSHQPNRRCASSTVF